MRSLRDAVRQVETEGEIPTRGHESRPKLANQGARLRAIRIKELQQRVGLSRTSIWRLEQRGLFPRRVHLTVSAVAWIEQEIDDWLRSRREGLD
jgi:prophage regulatory protein